MQNACIPKRGILQQDLHTKKQHTFIMLCKDEIIPRVSSKTKSNVNVPNPCPFHYKYVMKGVMNAFMKHKANEQESRGEKKISL